MKLQQIQLSEGLIKVPERLEQAAMKGLVSTILSQMASDIEEEVGPGSAVNQFRLWARKTYPGSRITHINLRDEPTELRLPRITKDDFDPRYQKAVSDPLVMPRVVITGDDIGDAAEYDAENDLITVSIDAVVAMDWSLYGRAAAAGERGQAATTEILARMSDMITRISGSLKHELMHYIQFNALVNMHGDQVDADRGNPNNQDEYYNSQTEFDPQIESAASMALALIAKLSRNVATNVDFRAIAAYVTGATSREQLIRTLGTDKMIPAAPYQFFLTLKRINPDGWKKAVKKFYVTLANRLQ